MTDLETDIRRFCDSYNQLDAAGQREIREYLLKGGGQGGQPLPGWAVDRLSTQCTAQEFESVVRQLATNHTEFDRRIRRPLEEALKRYIDSGDVGKSLAVLDVIAKYVAPTQLNGAPVSEEGAKALAAALRQAAQDGINVPGLSAPTGQDAPEGSAPLLGVPRPKAPAAKE